MQLRRRVYGFNRCSQLERSNTEICPSKTYARWLSRFVLVILSCAIANAQNPVSVEIGKVPYGISFVVSSAPNPNTSSPPEAQQEQAAAKPGSVIGTVLDQTRSVAAGVVV